jgi:hypothetical protein
MKLLIVVISAVFLMAAQPVSAAVSGAELLTRCEAAEKSMEGAKLSGDAMLDGMWCMGYMSGLLDGFSVGDYKVGDTKAVCPPEEGLTRTQALKVVTKWLREHPEAQQKNGRRGAVLALTSAYPCK